MQNDLISKSDFRKMLVKMQTDKENWNNNERRCAIGQAINLLDELPTAYDVDRVVERLEKSSYEVQIIETRCKLLNYDKAIEIVRYGGKG